MVRQGVIEDMRRDPEADRKRERHVGRKEGREREKEGRKMW